MNEITKFRVGGKGTHNCGLFRFPNGTAVAPEAVQSIQVAEADPGEGIPHRVIVKLGGSVVVVQFASLGEASAWGSYLADAVDYARTGRIRVIESTQAPDPEELKSLWEQCVKDMAKIIRTM